MSAVKRLAPLALLALIAGCAMNPFAKGPVIPVEASEFERRHAVVSFGASVFGSLDGQFEVSQGWRYGGDDIALNLCVRGQVDSETQFRLVEFKERLDEPSFSQAMERSDLIDGRRARQVCDDPAIVTGWTALEATTPASKAQ